MRRRKDTKKTQWQVILSGIRDLATALYWIVPPWCELALFYHTFPSQRKRLSPPSYFSSEQDKILKNNDGGFRGPPP